VSAKQELSIWQGFKSFLMRGNVVDLAVAVVIGAAFTNIVNSVVKGIINPVVGAFGTKDLDKYSSCLKGPCIYDVKTGIVREGVPIMWGTVLSSTLSFLITAAVVYFLMVLPMAKYLARQAARKAAQQDPAQQALDVTELDVLMEIRDGLIAQRSGPGRLGGQ
jgi:large conductance mechanosensitive channel